ncbi:MAG: hypothetical protein RL115_1783 [Bacteroidota bacterium]|jgi:gliding motility-associated-like protein
MRKLSYVSLLMSFCLLLKGQGVFVNTPNGFFKLTGAAGSCASSPFTNECLSQSGSSLLSMALFKDTLYFNTISGQLYSFKLGVAGSCRSYGAISGGNSLTVDKNGILYFATGSLLQRYNPYTNQTNSLGTMPFVSAGDLIFFNDKLLLAGSPSGIYEVNINDPSASTMYMNTNDISFFGLMSYPVSCGNTRFFGLSPAGNSTSLVEVDLVSRTVVGNVCTLPLNVYDAGSITETGQPGPGAISSLKVTHPCPPATTGSLQVITTLPAGTTNYILDNSITNTTGTFSSIGTGRHTLRIVAAGGCTIDTFFQITPGLNPLPRIQIVAASNCSNSNGQLLVTASSPHVPIRYALNGGAFVNSSTFTGLASGNYTISIIDTAGCSKDSTVVVPHQPARFIDTIIVKQEYCQLGNAQIDIRFKENTTTAVTSLNNAPFTTKFIYNNLSAGVYYLQVKDGPTCFFDTTFSIRNINNNKPAITIAVQDQLCYTNNGSIAISATGVDMPFTYQLGIQPFSLLGTFSMLAPGHYPLKVKNNNDCTWDTFAIVRPYPKLIPTTVSKVTHPTCRIMNNGSIQVSITGTQNPYRFVLNGKEYLNNQTATMLVDGKYKIYIRNKDGCVIDSIEEILKTVYEPYCNEVYMPTAFTPDNNGKNDRYKPLVSSFIKDLQVQLFNRYGQLVYSATGNATGWDGTLSGVAQPPGVFAFLVKYTDYYGQNKMQKGTFVLIR